MHLYPIQNYIFWLLLIIVLCARFSTYNYNSQIYFNGKNASFRSYVLRHPYEEDGFQIIEAGKYKFKTDLKFKYCAGQYLNFNFDKKYLENKVIYSPNIEISQSMTINAICLFSSFRDYLIQRVLGGLKQPYAGLLLGILIGYRQSFPSNFENAFKATGIVHIVVFSGANVSFITDLVLPLAKKFGSRLYFIFSSAIFIMILLLVGFEVPVIRASIMGFIKNFALIVGVDPDPFILIFYSAFVMLFIHPPLIESVSFYLSFGAVIAMVIAGDISSFVQGPFKDIVLSFLVSTLMFPLLGFYFGKVSLIGFFVNFLINFSIPFIMKFGFLYLIIPNLLFKMIVSIFLEYIFSVARLFSLFDFVDYSVNVSGDLLITFYLPVIAGYFFWKVFFAGAFIKYE
jgi:competence protein ComEC